MRLGDDMRGFTSTIGDAKANRKLPVDFRGQDPLQRQETFQFMTAEITHAAHLVWLLSLLNPERS